MRRTPAALRWLGCVVLALCIAGCGQEGMAAGNRGPADADDAVTGSPDTPVSAEPPPAGAPPDRAERPKVVPDAVDVRAVPWEGARVGEDGRTVTVRWWSGVPPCTVLAGLQVEEAPGRVVITVEEGRAKGSGDVACIEIAMRKKASVTLAEPLGERRLVDGATRS